MTGVMKNLRVITFVGAILLTLAAAQSLPALTPPGAAGGVYTRNLAVKKAFLVDFQAEWNRLGISQMFLDLMKSDGELDQADVEELQKLLSIDIVGREGIAAFYPDGNFFLMARPSADKAGEILASIRKELDSPKQRNGWLVMESDEGGLKVVSGVSSDAILIASQGAAERFFAGDRGLKMPVSGDLALWFEAPTLWGYLDDPNLGLPPDAVRAIKTFTGFAAAVNLELDGVHSSSSLCLDPGQDSDLAAIILTGENAWSLADLPRGVSVTTGVIDLPALGDYVNRWAAEFDSDLELDLSSFGRRYALIDAGASDPQEALQNPWGNLLVFLETKDSLTAEVTLLSWLQMAASFATPEGEGGFSVKAITVDGREGKEIQLGMAGTLYLVSYEDRLALATSRKALELLSGPRLSSDTGFTRLASSLPASYASASYSDNKTGLKQAAQMLPLVMMQTIEDPEAQQFMAEFTTKLSQFFDFAARKIGGSLSYTREDGSCLVSSGFTEVRW